jgi:hypothetical protein
MYVLSSLNPLPFLLGCCFTLFPPSLNLSTRCMFSIYPSSPGHTLRRGYDTPSSCTTRALSKPSAVPGISPSSPHRCHVPTWAKFLNHLIVSIFSILHNLSNPTKGVYGLTVGSHWQVRPLTLQFGPIWHTGPTGWLVGFRLTFDLPLWLGQQRSLTSRFTMQTDPKPSSWFPNPLTCAFYALSQLTKFVKYFFIWKSIINWSNLRKIWNQFLYSSKIMKHPLD